MSGTGTWKLFNKGFSNGNYSICCLTIQPFCCSDWAVPQACLPTTSTWEMDASAAWTLQRGQTPRTAPECCHRDKFFPPWPDYHVVSPVIPTSWGPPHWGVILCLLALGPPCSRAILLQGPFSCELFWGYFAHQTAGQGTIEPMLEIIPLALVVLNTLLLNTLLH